MFSRVLMQRKVCAPALTTIVRSMARKRRSRISMEHLFDEGAEEIFEKAMNKQVKEAAALQASKQQAAKLAAYKPKHRLLTYPDDETQLRQKSLPVTVFDAELMVLGDDLLQGMHAHDALGICAPQLGILKRIIAINPTSDGDKKFDKILVNPEIIKKSKEMDEFEEGCISFPTTHTVVKRSERVYVKYSDLNGVEKTEHLTGFSGRIVQHEIDHLNGVLMIDHKKKR